jgi:para-aminobenzoate synthetase component 1
VTLLIERIEPRPDPAEAAARLAHLPWLVWLDSATDPKHLGRWSIMSAHPWRMLRAHGAVTEQRNAHERAWSVVPGDMLQVLERDMAPLRIDAGAGQPPFAGGALGFIGYDWGRVLERRPAARHDDLAMPGAMFGLYDWAIAWDHEAGTCWLVSTGLPATGQEADRIAAERIQQVRTTLTGAEPPAVQPHAPAAAPPGRVLAPSYPVLALENAEAIGLRSTFTARGYLSAVQRVREYILAGDIFQANLSQRFEAPLLEAPLPFYQRLRRENPAPFGAYLACDDVTVLSVSPERFLSLTGTLVETRPIKGTRPRGLGPMHDQALGRELTESEKDRAENVMIVDLLRNDLSRVCRPGSVRVPELFTLEQHPTVHHLVSTVLGELNRGVSATELLRATFPGGSITGAPKVRAMEVIAELEPTERGLYCGSVGYISHTGDMDMNIAIRTCVLRNGRLYFSGGGGVVADSDPEHEYRETLHKVQGIVRTLARRAP